MKFAANCSPVEQFAANPARIRADLGGLHRTPMNDRRTPTSVRRSPAENFLVNSWRTQKNSWQTRANSRTRVRRINCRHIIDEFVRRAFRLN